MKRSVREARWADLPSARTRFTAEAVFLILVAAGAALAQLSPLSIIGLMLVAWLLVALIERASSREHAKAHASAEETDVLPMLADEPSADEPEQPAEEPRPSVASRWAFWRRERVAAEPLSAPTASLEERPSRGHVRKIEVEPAPQVTEVEPVVAEVVDTEIPAPGPAVTKRRLELPGLEETETVRAAASPPSEAPAEAPAETPIARPAVEPSAAEPPVEPPPVEPRVELPLAEPRVEPNPQPPPIERAPPPPPEPPSPPAPRPPAREWNIWDLERRAREQAGDVARDEEWTALFMNLRQYANADGVLPKEFDDLVRESFAELIQAA